MLTNKKYFFKIFFNENDGVEKFFISAFTLCSFLVIKNFYLMAFHYFEGRFIHGARDLSHRLFKKFIENEYNFFIQNIHPKC